MKRRVAVWLVVLVLCALPTALAGGTKLWVQRTGDDFASGSLQGLAVRSSGDMLLSPLAEEVAGLQAGFVWDLAVGPKGEVYAATGSPAAAWVIESGKARLLQRTSEQHALCLAVDAAGNVFLATAPRGIIYKIAPSGQVTILADLDDNYIWAMKIDAKGRLLAATGPNGRLYAIDTASGKAEVLFASSRSHLMCLETDAAGAIYVGTQPDGILYRIAPDGKPFVILDADEDEIHCLVFGPDGDLYAGTAGEVLPPQLQAGLSPGPQPGQGPGQGPGMPSPAAMGAVGGVSVAVSGRPETGRVVTGVYRIKPDGDFVKVFTLAGASVYSLAVDRQYVYVGTGTKGHILRVEDENESTILVNRPEQQILTMRWDRAGRLLVGTGGPGTVMLLEKRSTPKGEYLSRVFDAGYLARWGRLAWKADAPRNAGVQIFARVGNSGRPDETWSPWAGPLSDPEGPAPELPLARFAQVRAVLETGNAAEGPVLHEISWAYACRNRAPVISQFIVDGQSARRGRAVSQGGQAAGQPPAPQQMPGQPAMQMPRARFVKTLAWNAADPDGDPITYCIEFRGVGEKQWRTLEGKIVNRNNFLWDTNRVPDGWYLVRLVASDEANNPPADTFRTIETADPVLVDNHRPEIKDLKAVRVPGRNRIRIEGIAVDSLSRIETIQVSVDATDWVPVFPIDGLFDSREEKFAWEMDAPTDGRDRILVFVARDGADNEGSGRIVVPAMPLKPEPPVEQAPGPETKEPTPKPEPSKPSPPKVKPPEEGASEPAARSEKEKEPAKEPPAEKQPEPEKKPEPEKNPEPARKPGGDRNPPSTGPRVVG